MIACATKTSSPPLYSAFTRYSTGVDERNLKIEYGNYFTPRPLGEESLADPEVVNHLLFPRYMRSESAHFEKVRGPTGCLTINGLSTEGEPMTFALAYTVKKSAEASGEIWLIDEILMAFHESPSASPTAAKCPDELKNQGL